MANSLDTTANPPMWPEEWDDEYEDTICTNCGGSGADPWESFLPCEECDGEGYYWWL